MTLRYARYAAPMTFGSQLVNRLVRRLLSESAQFTLRRVRDRWDVLRRLDVLEANAVASLQARAAPHVLAPENGQTEPLARRAFRQREFKVFSQHGEDGLLLHLFSAIGTTDRRFVEFACADGRECNSANLAIHCGWSGLAIEGHPARAANACRYFASRPELKPDQVQVACAFVTADTINELLSRHGVTGEIDLLSIDIDGNDYWLWQATTVVRPRVVVIEYNASFTVERAVTIPYDPAFDRTTGITPPGYHGASLPALVQLGASKGYALVGCNSHGFNAFFVRNDLLTDATAVLSAPDAFYPNASRYPDPRMDWEGLKHLPFVDVASVSAPRPGRSFDHPIVEGVHERRIGGHDELQI